jgi:extracellular matrix regulatory protein B
MYIHLGGNIIINSKDIVAWFDIDKTTVSKTTRKFLKDAQANNDIIYINMEELPKSFILTSREKNINKIYLSNLTVQTIVKRNQENYLK